MKSSYYILAFAIVSNALANILIKTGINRAGGLRLTQLSDIVHNFLLNWVIWLGIVFFGLTLLAYANVLSNLNLSVAYPIMTSLGLVIVTLVSVLFLHERLLMMQIAGILFIILGVWMVAR